MTDVSDYDKDRAIAERLGQVRPFRRGDACYIPAHNHIDSDAGLYWPAYGSHGVAFVRLLGRLPRYTMGQTAGHHWAKIFHEDEQGRHAVTPATPADEGDCPMTALRDAAYKWVRRTDD